MRKYTNGAEFGDLSYWTSTSGTVTANSTTKRSGAYSYYFSSTTPYASKSIVPMSEFYYRFVVYMTSVAGSNYRILTWKTAGSTNAGSLRVDTLGRLNIYDYSGLSVASTTRSLKANQWNLIEVHLIMHDTVGKVEVKLNTILEVSYTGPTTSSSYPCNALEHGRMAHYLDDIALNDTDGSVNNSWCGDGHLEILKPDGNGDVIQWSPNTGLNWQAVDEVPPDNDTTYVMTSGIGIQDMYSVGAYVGTGKIISQIWAEAIAKDNAATGSGILKLGFKTGGSVFLSSGVFLSSVYDSIVGDFTLINPVTLSGWTADDLNNIQVVIESD